MSECFWWGDLQDGVVNAKRELMLDGWCRLWGVILSILGYISVTTCNVNIGINRFSGYNLVSHSHRHAHTHKCTLPEYCFLQHWDVDGLSACRWAQVVLQSHEWQHVTVCRSNHMKNEKSCHCEFWYSAENSRYELNKAYVFFGCALT